MTKRKHPTTRTFRFGSGRPSEPASPPKRRSGNGRGLPALIRMALRGGLILGAVFLLVSVALVLPWRWLAPPTSAFMLSAQWHADREIRHHWVEWQALSRYLPIAVVAAEDQKFPHHYGFDFESIAKATRERRSRIRGASTITQQVAKNLYLWPGRSYVRKGLEAWLTVLIETLWSKRRILEVYLNIAEFGRGVFGAGAASQTFFRKPPDRLTLREAALLAAVLPSPQRMSAARPSAYVHRRAREIAGWVRKLGGPQYLSDL
jgi:monofunctional biosynthetic peptidoglycan transglycosylase